MASNNAWYGYPLQGSNVSYTLYTNTSSSSTVWYSHTPTPEGPVDPTKLDELRAEIIAKLTVENEKPGFRDGDGVGPNTLNARVLELIFAVLLREGLLSKTR